MTRDKKHGGLCVRVARHQNTALLGKIIWDIMNSKDKLWLEMFKELHFKDGNVFNSLD